MADNFDVARVNNNAAAIQQHLNDFVSGTTYSSLDEIDIFEEHRGANVIVVVRYTS